MSYRGKPKNLYGNRPPRRPPTSHIRKAQKETEWGIKLNPPCITKTEKIQEEETPVPEETEEVEKKSLGLSFGNQAGNIGISGSNEKEKTKKFPKGTDYV